MTSMAGYVNYIKYTAGSNKGATAQGDVLNSPFGLGKVDPNYTSASVIETLGDNLKLIGNFVEHKDYGRFSDPSDGCLAAFCRVIYIKEQIAGVSLCIKVGAVGRNDLCLSFRIGES